MNFPPLTTEQRVGMRRAHKHMTRAQMAEYSCRCGGTITQCGHMWADPRETRGEQERSYFCSDCRRHIKIGHVLLKIVRVQLPRGERFL